MQYNLQVCKNTSQVGRVMSKEINEQSVESETEGFEKGIYILALLFQNKNKIK